MPTARNTSVLPGYLNALGATLAWSGNFVVARILAGQLSPVEISFWRWGMAFLFLFPFVCKEIWQERARIFQHRWMFLSLGLIGVTLINTLNYQAGISTDATSIALIATSAPIFMALITMLFFKERLSYQQVVGLCIALVGVLILVTRGSLERLLAFSFSEGDLWALLGALFFAAYTVQLRYRPNGFSAFGFLGVLFGIGTAGLLPFMVWQSWSSALHWPTLAQFGSLLYISIGASIIGFFFWNKAIDQIGPVRSGVLYYSIPLFSSLEAAWLLGEKVSTPQLLGGFLIIGGILFSTLETLRRLSR